MITMPSIDGLLKTIDLALSLPKVAREQPMNLAHLKLLILIHQYPDIRTDDLLPYFQNEKPTLISRINYLENKKLLLKFPKYNTGGNTHPNYYRLTKTGQRMVSQLVGEGIAVARSNTSRQRR